MYAAIRRQREKRSVKSWRRIKEGAVPIIGWSTAFAYYVVRRATTRATAISIFDKFEQAVQANPGAIAGSRSDRPGPLLQRGVPRAADRIRFRRRMSAGRSLPVVVLLAWQAWCRTHQDDHDARSTATRTRRLNSLKVSRLAGRCRLLSALLRQTRYNSCIRERE